MLAITAEALEAIRLVEDASGAGVRISASPHEFNGSGPGVRIEVAETPAPDDQVVDAGGAVVFLAPSAAAFEDKLLDIELDSGDVHFVLVDQDAIA